MSSVKGSENNLNQLSPPWRHLSLPLEGGLAMLLGGLALAIADVIDICWSVPVPLEAMSLRWSHLAYSMVSNLSAGAFLALPLLVISLTSKVLQPRAGWFFLLYGLWVSALTLGVVCGQYERFFSLARGSLTLLVVATLGFAFSIPALVLLAMLAKRSQHWGYLLFLLGVGGLTAGHAFLRDDYQILHLAVLWASMTLLGALVVPKMSEEFFAERRARSRLFLLSVCLCVLGVGWQPRNALRIELFKQPGSVISWLYAQHLWQDIGVNFLPHVRKKSSRTVQETRSEDGRPPVIVLITIDALRADVLNLPEIEKKLPYLAWLKRGGTYFTRATSSGSQTSVALTSLFTSRYFSQLSWAPYGRRRPRHLYAAKDRSERFPELLSKAGIYTESILPLLFLAEEYGVTRGFSKSTELVNNGRHARANEVMSPLLIALGEHKHGPGFYYAHLMEPHYPYNRGKLQGKSDWERYLSEVQVVDMWLGQLIKTMHQNNRPRWVLILTADHGEAFGEHRTRQHGKSLYDELVHVPLIFWGPGIPSRVIQYPVGHVDLGPTILAAFRLPAPTSYMGSSLWGTLRGGKPPPRPLIAEGRLRRALYTDQGLKVIEDTLRKTLEVYDLKEDPLELRNLFDKEPRRAHPAVAKLRGFFKTRTLIAEGRSTPYKH